MDMLVDVLEKKLTKWRVTNHPSALQEFKAEIIEMLVVECNLSLQNHCSISEPKGSPGDVFQEGLYGKSEELHTNSLMPTLGVTLSMRKSTEEEPTQLLLGEFMSCRPLFLHNRVLWSRWAHEICLAQSTPFSKRCCTKFLFKKAVKEIKQPQIRKKASHTNKQWL